jgi:hypothetical protein
MARVFDGLSPEQARQVAEAYEQDHETQLEQDFDAADLPTGALSLSTQLQEKRADLFAEGAGAGTPRDRQRLYGDLAGLGDEERAKVVQQLHPELRKQVNVMFSMKEDLDELRAMAAGTLDPASVDRVMAGRPPAERQALLDASGIAERLPGAARHGELTELEKEAAALQLRCALGTTAGGEQIVDKASAAYVFANVNAEQAQDIKWAFFDETRTQIGDAFAGNQDVLPQALRVKEVHLDDPEQKKKIDADVDTLFRALDGGCDEDTALNTLRNQSRSEILALASATADSPSNAPSIFWRAASILASRSARACVFSPSSSSSSRAAAASSSAVRFSLVGGSSGSSFSVLASVATATACRLCAAWASSSATSAPWSGSARWP